MKVVILIAEKNKIIEFLKTGNSLLADMESQTKRNFIRKAHKFVLLSETLYFGEDRNNLKLVVANDDTETQLSIFGQLHLPDHTGMKAMYKKSKELYIGFKRENLDNYVSNCTICNRYRPLVRITPIIPILSDFPWQLVQMDCIDLRNYSEFNDGYGWIVNIIDSYSKFMFPVAVKNKTAENIKAALKLQVDREGAPKIVQTDNGKEFNNSLLTDYLNQQNIIFRRGRPRHPQNQGQVERANQTLVRKIAKSLSDKSVKNWVDILQDIVSKYNKTWNRAINQTPMMAFRGRCGYNSSSFIAYHNEEISYISGDVNLIAELSHSITPVDSTSEAVENDICNVENPKPTIDLEYRNRYINRMLQDADVHYHSININPGDIVLLKRDFDMNTQNRKRKMEDFFEEGTWIVIRRIGSDNLRIKSRENDIIEKTVCKNRLKKINS
jgi:hypothetical protein